MTIISSGSVPDFNEMDAAKDWKLFCSNVDLVLRRVKDIIACSDYFFCRPAFGLCNWTYVNGDGPLSLGHLLLGWRDGVLVGMCPVCSGSVLVVSFAGSPLSGSNRWTGFCLGCRARRKGSWQSGFSAVMLYVVELRRKYPFEIGEWETYVGEVFSWGGDGTKLGVKRHLVTKHVTEPASFEALIAELMSDNCRRANPPKIIKLKEEFKLRLTKQS